MKTTIEMAREANLPACHTTHSKALERFAALVRADEREALAQPEQRLKQVAHVYLLDAKGWPKVGWDDGRGIKVGDKLYTLTSAEELLAELISAPENVSIPQPEERNFCPRCGKRTADPTTIHTCTPPQSERPWVGLTDEDLLTILGGELDSSDEAFLRFGRALIVKLKKKNS